MIILWSIFFTAALVLGVKIITHEGMALHYLKIRAEATGKKYFEPLIICEWCMPSVYSLFGWGFTFLKVGWHPESLYFYPITVAATSVITGTLWTVIMILIKYLNFIQNNDN
jgi:hypothetical protein